jgi:hypothetical protein
MPHVVGAHHGSMSANDYTRKGRGWGSELRPPRDQWVWHFSAPLILNHAPWYRLPVGVVSILSNRSDGKLAFVSEAREGLGAEVAGELRDVLSDSLTDLLSPP